MHDESGDLPAGDFAGWMRTLRAAVRGEGESDVPCGSCTACCRSSQFIHIEPDETAALAAIPAKLLFRAPRMPEGHVLIGYDKRGHCPMLVEDKCSIYAHRPRTCRTYDCRVFAATGGSGIDADSEVAVRANRWRFDLSGTEDRARLEAVQAAAVFLRDRADTLPEGTVPSHPAQRAVLAIRLHGAFLAGPNPDPEAVRAELDRSDR